MKALRKLWLSACMEAWTQNKLLKMKTSLSDEQLRPAWNGVARLCGEKGLRPNGER